MLDRLLTIRLLIGIQWSYKNRKEFIYLVYSCVEANRRTASWTGLVATPCFTLKVYCSVVDHIPAFPLLYLQYALHGGRGFEGTGGLCYGNNATVIMPETMEIKACIRWTSPVRCDTSRVIALLSSEAAHTVIPKNREIYPARGHIFFFIAIVIYLIT